MTSILQFASLKLGDQATLFSVLYLSLCPPLSVLLIIELSPEQGFSQTLPEELKTGKWNVYRLEQLVQITLCILRHN